MRKVFTASNIRTFSFLIALILAIPVSWKGLTGFYLWLSPFIMLNSVFAVKNFVWLNLAALPVLIFILFRRRWFCKHLCPAGCCFDKVSSLNKSKASEYSRLPDMGKWLAIISLMAAIFGVPLFIILDPIAIFNGFFTVFSGKQTIIAIISFSIFPVLLIIHLIFPGIWCKKLCPLGGLQTALWDIKSHLKRIFGKQVQEAPVDYSGRRYFIMSGVGILTGLTIHRLLKSTPKQPIRPPASVEPYLLNYLCCRCGNCIKACPTGIIVPRAEFNDPLAWMTPEIIFKQGYCLETCNMCSRVCPSGAITLFSTEAKGQLFMGTATINTEDCYLSNNKECVKCRESCKYDAIKFVPQNNILNMIPVSDTTKCVGCGACGVVCPAECIVIKPTDI